MDLYNSLTKQNQLVATTDVSMYSCGPTVYDHVHIGNLSAFIYADSLRRALTASGATVQHVMNLTDVDDKTIAKSQTQGLSKNPVTALKETTEKYSNYFYEDMKAMGNDLDAMNVVKATDFIDQMQKIILELLAAKMAYIADDGVYFSLEAYKKQGNAYGKLVSITAESTGASRVDNDEYDKDDIHDFALWKTAKAGEPAWPFEINGKDLTGRPGWHIECSAMAESSLGLPFTIHTGGIDLQFPHHENEIAQSTGSGKHQKMAEFFVHNEHLLVEGKKMSKSLGNFYRLNDIVEKGFQPLAFRLLMLKSHYRSASNFTWTGLQGAQNQLKNLQAMAVMQFQAHEASPGSDVTFREVKKNIALALADDLNLPETLVAVSLLESHIAKSGLASADIAVFAELIAYIDEVLGLQLGEQQDIGADQKELLATLDEARANKDYAAADATREILKSSGVEVRSKNNRSSEWFYA